MIDITKLSKQEVIDMLNKSIENGIINTKKGEVFRSACSYGVKP